MNPTTLLVAYLRHVALHRRTSPVEATQARRAA